jgi:pyruvate-formate lyase-activating enzyme
MNIYHITYAPDAKSLCLHFWGCNMSCRGCLCQKEIYDCHLEETKDAIFEQGKKPAEKPTHFLHFHQVLDMLESLDFGQVIFMGMEATLDPELPKLAETLHKEFQSNNILLTNGLSLTPLEHIDEVVLSIKAYRDDLHRDYTGVLNKKALENFVRIYSWGKRLRAESVLIPDYIDSLEIERIAGFIAGVDKTIPYRIDAYFPAGDNPWRRATPEEVEEAVGVARKYLLNVSCLRGDEKLKYRVVRIY